MESWSSDPQPAGSHSGGRVKGDTRINACDYAIERWEDPNYYHECDQMRRGMVLRWRAMKDRIREMAREMKRK